MERYACIHGHFYQPPRENPWLEAIELQDSAYPYHDWNERITAECYASNATSRILDGESRITRLVNNYSRISFNFGPTLLAWMEQHAPATYEAILEADRESRQRFSGHGSALSQPYNHMILPLANRRDKGTQVIWGIADFEYRFGRRPEGMWLPETAVDIETLEILSENGILFTLLAPNQAHRVRPVGKGDWQDVSGGRIDPTMAYKLVLPSGRSISLFFYDGPISQAVAFEGLLNNGEAFADRLLEAFNAERTWPQLAHIATDGESYGHHHKNGDMALAYALDHIESQGLARLTNYAEYLELCPPTHEVEIFANSSWSCVHGIERWRANCGCNSGGYPHWNQEWRGPLRAALDWLRDPLALAYQVAAGVLLKNPWGARNDYITIMSERSPESVEVFFHRHALHTLTEAETIRALKLLELQRHAMLMYTSCGWFFDELSGIETVQVLRYAGRAVQLAEELFGAALEEPFLERLEQARSNIPEYRNGRNIYEKWVRPSMVDLTKVAVHYAINSMFEEYAEESSVFSYSVTQEDYQGSQVGRVKCAVGRARFTSNITRESATLMFGVLHMGDHNLNCGVSEYEDEEQYEAVLQELSEAFTRADFPESIRLMDKHFGAANYSITSLFYDQQREALALILEPTQAEALALYSQIYDRYAPLIRFLFDSGIPLPQQLHAAAGFVLNDKLRHAFQEDPVDPQSVEALLEETRLAGIPLDATTLEFALRKGMERTADRFSEDPQNVELLRNLRASVTLVGSMPFEVNLRSIQNVCYKIIEDRYSDFQRQADRGDAHAAEWIDHISDVAEKLWINIRA
ncbi:MAG: DUF3536 domain-containing protein [Desulfomonile tiedjei]|nr:DUF3536 domain-containing protein [Desulfomonile tiedjei]